MAKSKWKNSKDTFRRELQKEPINRSGAKGDDNFEWKSKWPFFKMMLFCRDVLLPSPTSGNLPDLDNDLENDTQQNTSCTSWADDTDVEVDVNSEHAVYSERSPTTLDNEHLANNILKKKMKKSRKIDESNIDSFLALEQKKIKILENAQKNENQVNNDPDYHFLISLLPCFKDLNALEKLEVRNNIQSVVIDAHRRKLMSSNSVPSTIFTNNIPVESQNYLPPMTLTSQERSHHMSNDYHIPMPLITQGNQCKSYNIQTSTLSSSQDMQRENQDFQLTSNHINATNFEPKTYFILL
ncbi:unnamed protein product [Macrosiphum euphorbiae]|uniref:BESS domain-containing protein n=1 Tax=Macrosiphum euphorbiae TaxID=13131 RepID=A0AAV0Y2S2_9HEMI|nr:unnamed protein product [Macrosiphum euphorbiae]CAI6373754.1 unnamed protein product [Macrosiphum euphorbiae]